MLSRLGLIALLGKRPAQTLMRLGEFRPDAHCPPKLNDRLIKIALRGPDPAQIMIRLGIVRIDFHGLLEMLGRLLQSARSNQDVAQVEVNFASRRAKLQRPTVIPNRISQFTPPGQ